MLRIIKLYRNSLIALAVALTVGLDLWFYPAQLPVNLSVQRPDLNEWMGLLTTIGFTVVIISVIAAVVNAIQVFDSSSSNS